MDWLGFYDDSRLIPASYYNNKAQFINLNDDQKKFATKQFSNTYGYESAYRSTPNISASYTDGNTKLIGDSKKFGYIYAIGYGEGRRVSNRIRNEYESYNFFDYNYNTNTYDIRSNLSALVNLTYSYRKSKFSWKTLYNNDFIKTVGIRNGYDVSNGEQYKFNIKSTNTETSQNGIINSVVEGSHSLNRSLALDWNGSYSRTYRWQPDQKILALHTDSNSDIYNLTLSNENSPEIRNAGRVYSFQFENIYGSSINITKQFKWLSETQKLKIGTSNYYRDRNVEVNALGYSVLNSAGNRLSIPESKTTTFNSIFSPGNIDAFNLTVANIATNSTDYTGTALMNAGFAMLDNKFSDKIKLNMGCKS